jgi:RHS repeat-associated protein
MRTKGRTAESQYRPEGTSSGFVDADTSLVHFGYRDYDPDVGRFTTKDPIGYACGDHDLYGYCMDDPVNRVDPWGLKAQKQKQEKAWLWKANSGACEKCQALDGRVFKEYPGRPHPNCKCQIIAFSDNSKASKHCKDSYEFCLKSRKVTDADISRLMAYIEECEQSSACSRQELQRRKNLYRERQWLRYECEEIFDFCKRGDKYY